MASLTYGDALIDWIQYEDGYAEGYQCVLIENQGRKIYKRDTSLTQEIFVEQHWKEYWDKKNKQELNYKEDRAYAFNFFKELLSEYDEIVAVGIIDKNLSGFRHIPRYEIKVLVPKDVSDERVYDLYEQLPLLCKNANENAQRKTKKHTFKFKAIYSPDEDIVTYEKLKDCNYVFKKTE